MSSPSECGQRRASICFTCTGAWCPLLAAELLVQLFLAHLPDEHLEQAADHEERVVGLPDEQLTAEEEEEEKAENCGRITSSHAGVKGQNEDGQDDLHFPKLELHTVIGQ